MNKEQIWVKCNNQEELNQLKSIFEEKNITIDLCETPLNWPIILDSSLKVAFSADKPSYCSVYMNCGGKIYSYEEYTKGE